jgi:hypothetical protein
MYTSSQVRAPAPGPPAPAGARLPGRLGRCPYGSARARAMGAPSRLLLQGRQRAQQESAAAAATAAPCAADPARPPSPPRAQAPAQHWGPVAVKHLPGRGRGLVASRQVAAGELLLVSLPLAVRFCEEGSTPENEELAEQMAAQGGWSARQVQVGGAGLQGQGGPGSSLRPHARLHRAGGCRGGPVAAVQGGELGREQAPMGPPWPEPATCPGAVGAACRRRRGS